MQGVQQNSLSEEYARAAYYLQKEVGLSHAEIFGGKEVVVRDDGVVEEVYTSAMNINTLQTYLDLMEMDVEEQKQQKKKAKMQSKMRNARM